jgi:hypothetical protein
MEIDAVVCKQLSKTFGLPEPEVEETPYTPPEKPGLQNSRVIIPSYYKLHSNPQKMFTLDYYEIIKDDIRNMRELSDLQIEYIKKLSHEDKNELFDIFNKCLKCINESFD